MIHVQHLKQSVFSKIGDLIMLPLMYLLQGTIREVPQQSHRWNNVKYKATELNFLQGEMMVTEEQETTATTRWLGPLPLFHMPIIGGWKHYVVLEPVVKQDVWFIGWVVGDAAGISQIQLYDKVRMLRGPTTVQFFGVNEHGEQIHLHKVGEGKVGNSAEFSKTPLL